ncbi:hypothetical protein AAFF_G00359430 [Aldrovandia affinis]|uniref:Uncharacterized protein n=1 Tax=Aldrovandia affinis TaxID=143900 RepID=A0AAD7SJ24_9TELE|nr:hypothetical protein AAFF_G00359430 [Aldrovandia affinis]
MHYYETRAAEGSCFRSAAGSAYAASFYALDTGPPEWTPAVSRSAFHVSLLRPRKGSIYSPLSEASGAVFAKCPAFLPRVDGSPLS